MCFTRQVAEHICCIRMVWSILLHVNDLPKEIHIQAAELVLGVEEAQQEVELALLAVVAARGLLQHAGWRPQHDCEVLMGGEELVQVAEAQVVVTGEEVAEEAGCLLEGENRLGEVDHLAKPIDAAVAPLHVLQDGFLVVVVLQVLRVGQVGHVGVGIEEPEVGGLHLHRHLLEVVPVGRGEVAKERRGLPEQRGQDVL